MAYNYLRLALLGCLSFCFVFNPAVAVASDARAADSAGPRPHLLRWKAAEWRIMQKLGEITRPEQSIVAPAPTTPAFVRRPDDTVIWQEERYTRYVPVSSADELRKALSTAKPGDFIHLQDGIYQGNFVIDQPGSDQQRIALYGTRRAVLDGQSIKRGYGLQLMANYWVLAGFTIRNVRKGLVLDQASHNLISGLEIYQTGAEGLHLWRFSRVNRVTRVWIHDTGLVNAEFGEGISVGSAVSNWPEYTDSQPDHSDHNQIIGNVLGPNLTAVAIDLKEGTTGGIVRNNSFLSHQQGAADSWVDVKGNGYDIKHNQGLYLPGGKFRVPVAVHQPVAGWGQNNAIADNQAYVADQVAPLPFFVAAPVPAENANGFASGDYLILLARPLPYTLSELAAYYPDSFQALSADSLLLWTNIHVGRGAELQISTDDVARVRLLSTPKRYVNITGFRSQIIIEGSPTQRLNFESWNPAKAQPDGERNDGRAYILATGGRMDITDAGFFDLGYEEGTVSGVAWKSDARDGEASPGRGNVSNSHFVRNYFGAYTFEAVAMRWVGNTFAHNISYGFDPHDFSNDFLVENNLAHNNGSHGIIFSRGCDRNVIRGNQSFDNQGHGIMLDDGKVIPDSENERYHQPVPSSHNVIEDNIIVNNADGIVIEGGTNNIVRRNLLRGPHRYGVRLTDQVVASLVVSNTIEDSQRFGIIVHNHSTNNRFEQNTIAYGGGGIAVEDGPHNTFTHNDVRHIQGSAVSIKGDRTGMVIDQNSLGEGGDNPLAAEQTTGVDGQEIAGRNAFGQWRLPQVLAIPYFMLSIWGIIVGIPLILILRRLITG